MFKIMVQWNQEGLKKIDDRFTLMPGAIAKIVEAIAIYGEGRMKHYARLPGQYRTMLNARMVSPFTWTVGATGKARNYAHFLNYGTDPSRGRYLPFFEKRFSKEFLASHPPPYKGSIDAERGFIGTHPGNKRAVGPQGLRFYEQALDDMEGNAEKIGTQIIQALLNSGNIGVQK